MRIRTRVLLLGIGLALSMLLLPAIAPGADERRKDRRRRAGQLRRRAARRVDRRQESRHRHEPRHGHRRSRPVRRVGPGAGPLPGRRRAAGLPQVQPGSGHRAGQPGDPREPDVVGRRRGGNHHGHGRRHPGADHDIGGRQGRRREADSRAAAERPQLRGSGAADAGRHDAGAGHQRRHGRSTSTASATTPTTSCSMA